MTSADLWAKNQQKEEHELEAEAPIFSWVYGLEVGVTADVCIYAVDQFNSLFRCHTWARRCTVG